MIKLKSSEYIGQNVAPIKEITLALAKELILNLDSGYINTNKIGKISMEALIFFVYRPEPVMSNSKDT